MSDFGITRRGFIGKVGQGLLPPNVAGGLLKEASAQLKVPDPAGRKLMVAYRCRYEPHNREAIRIARSGELGPIQMILADAGFAIGDPNQWRLNKQLAGGGSLMDIGIYALNASRYLTGEEPTEV